MRIVEAPPGPARAAICDEHGRWLVRGHQAVTRLLRDPRLILDALECPNSLPRVLLYHSRVGFPTASAWEPRFAD